MAKFVGDTILFLIIKTKANGVAGKSLKTEGNKEAYQH